MARWLVELNGEPFDVDEFRRWFPSGEMRAIAENGKVYLTGEVFETLTDAARVYEAARLAADECFAIIALLQPELRRPSVGTVFREENDGSRSGYAFSAGSATGRSKARGTLEVQGEASGAALTQAQVFLAASRSNRHLEVAVSLLASPGCNWAHLYRCLEEIEYYLGRKVSDAGLCSDNLRERFTRSANAAEISGRDSRHRLGKFVPPSDPMSLSEAHAFVSQALQAVLRQVAGQGSGQMSTL